MKTLAKVLELKNIKKEYYGNVVLKGVNLSLSPGEIHCIVGENGAGKSTLMNIIFGMPVIHNTGGYSGEILLAGEPVTLDSPKTSLGYGIGMVHQEFMLIPGFTIAENIKLNREITKSNLVSKILGKKLESLDFKQMNSDAQEALKVLGLDVDVTKPISGLPVSYKQFTEIAREIDKENLKVLVFDEPTAALTEEDASKLLADLKKLSAKGIAILFISHRLDEVLEIADNITVLRDGEIVGRPQKDEATVNELARLMVGRKVERVKKAVTDANDGQREMIMRIENLTVNMVGEEVKGVNLEIKRGEILGIGGLAGHGKIGIANGIMGLHESSGQVFFNGQKLDLNNPTQALRAGLAFVSEDRRGIGLLLDESIEINIAITAMQVRGQFLKTLSKIPFFNLEDRKMIRNHALKMIEDLDIRCTGPEQLVERLSGGNQQKVCIARAITLEPEILFVSEPTRGIDVGVKKIVLDLLVRLNQKFGTTIVITSSELAELRMISDRIAIVHKGKLEGILPADASDIDFGLMMAGEFKEKGVS